ncbi:MAG: PIN domain-containing protein [Verrucomicrobia subdivision 3 bacterium]|nr:PIN domain-containing protein [Limisphaerales bacterium]
MTETILDTGPLVAFVDADEQYHGWAAEQFRRLPAGFVTCEAVLTEAFFLLGFSAIALKALSGLLRERHIKVPFRFSDESEAVMQLMRRYHEVPMSFADACLVRMAELNQRASILTLDRHFRIYRKNRRQVIPVVIPHD